MTETVASTCACWPGLRQKPWPGNAYALLIKLLFLLTYATWCSSLGPPRPCRRPHLAWVLLLPLAKTVFTTLAPAFSHQVASGEPSSAPSSAPTGLARRTRARAAMGFEWIQQAFEALTCQTDQRPGLWLRRAAPSPHMRPLRVSARLPAK